MTTPVVAARASASTAFGTSHSITLPSGITAGDLLVVVFYSGTSTSTPSTSSSGWSMSAVSTSSNGCGAVFYKVATGSDALSVTTATSAVARHVSLRITGASGTPTITSTTGTSAAPDPPSVTPAGGSADYLYIAAAGESAVGVTSTTITSAPSGYSNLTRV